MTRRAPPVDPGHGRRHVGYAGAPTTTDADAADGGASIVTAGSSTMPSFAVTAS